MKILSYLPHPFMVAILAGFMQLIQFQWAAFIAWTGFASWACYFIYADNTPIKTTAKILLCWLAGSISAIGVIKISSTLFIGKLGFNPATAIPISLTIVAFFVICCENIKPLNLLPVWFISAACYFGLYQNNNDWSVLFNTAAQLFIGGVIGQLFGYLTVFCRTWYSQRINPLH